MATLINSLFVEVWWRYSSEDPSGFSFCYHWFNLLEGLAWLLISVLVLQRFLKHRNSRVEIAYSLLFATFGASDFIEAWQQSSWLIWLKVVNLCFLFHVRRQVMRNFYPDAKLY